MEATEQLSTQTSTPNTFIQLAADIDRFWCNFDPYEEAYSGSRSEEDKEMNIQFIAEDIYQSSGDTIERFREVVDDPLMPEVSEEAQGLITRFNKVKIAH